MILFVSVSCGKNEIVEDYPEEVITMPVENKEENNAPKDSGKKKELNNIVFAEVEPGKEIDEEFAKLMK